MKHPYSLIFCGVLAACGGAASDDAEARAHLQRTPNNQQSQQQQGQHGEDNRPAPVLTSPTVPVPPVAAPVPLPPAAPVPGPVAGPPAIPQLPPAFPAALTIAPEDHAILCGVHLLEVKGVGIDHVNMVTSDRFLVRNGATLMKDNAFTMVQPGTTFHLWFDVRGGNLSGEQTAVITAYDAKGDAVVVAQRTWTLDTGRAIAGDAAKAACAPFLLFYPDTVQTNVIPSEMMTMAKFSPRKGKKK